MSIRPGVDRVNLSKVNRTTNLESKSIFLVLFKRLKVELGQDLVSFATADASQIPPLESYQGDCEPVFLAYGGGEMVGKMVGCNAPIIERTIKELAQFEQDILDGKVQRTKNNLGITNATEDTTANESAPAEEQNANTDEPHEISKIVTCLIIKPDILKEVITHTAFTFQNFYLGG